MRFVLQSRGRERAGPFCKNIAVLFNGDPRLPYPVHIVVPATRGLSRFDVADMMTDVYLQAGLLSGCRSELPSQNRWGTMNDVLQGQVAEQSFRTWEDGSFAGAENDEDQKKRHPEERLEDPMLHVRCDPPEESLLNSLRQYSGGLFMEKAPAH